MYAAHFAAALAIKGRVSKAPTWALMAGAFLPDFVWITLGLAGVEPSQGSAFFDDWSHSLAMVLLSASLFAVFFWRKGFVVVLATWLAVLSHFLLDLPIHPKNLAVFPHSSAHLGWNAWDFGQTKWLAATRYWWLELVVVSLLLMIYVAGARKARFATNLTLACCILVFGLHLLSLQ
ncbi:MAG TPA: hypothetical protein VF753_15810 [Terriglobales bacterium]